MNDIFKKIIAREVPADIVYEDDTTMAFLDVNPINIGHTLIVPKNKFVNVFDADSEVLGHMMQVAQKIALALKTITKCDGININMNNEESAGQRVFHAHIHVIPRFEGDGAYQPAKHVAKDEEKTKQVALFLKQALT